MTEVVLPDGTPVTYTYNVLGQRTAKSVDGVVEKYLWGGVNQQLLAVLDGSDAVVARFEYAGGGSVAPASRRPCLRADAERAGGRVPCPCRLPLNTPRPFFSSPSSLSPSW